MLASLHDDIFVNNLFINLPLTESVRIGSVCQELRRAVHGLRRLDISRDGSSRLSMPALMAFDQVEELSLDGFHVDDAVAEQLLAGMPKLQHLKVTKADVSGLDVFAAAPALKHLALPFSATLYQQSSPAFASWPSLKSLEVTRTVLSDLQLDALLRGLPGLEKLVARDCRNIQACSLLPEEMPRLKELDLSGTSIADRAVGQWASVPSLCRLRLDKCRRLQSPKIVSLQLQSLSLARCESLSKPHISTPHLEELVFAQTDVYDDVVEQCLSCCWTSLRILDLRECCQVQLRQCKAPSGLRLEHLAVSRSQVSCSFVEAILAKAPDLMLLEAADMLQSHEAFRLNPTVSCSVRQLVLDQADTAALENCMSCCPGLQALSLRFCVDFCQPPPSATLVFLEVSGTGLNDVGIGLLGEACPSLRTLLARDCQQLERSVLVGDWLRYVCLAKAKHLQALEVRAPRLTALDLGECPALATLETCQCSALREVNLFLSSEAWISRESQTAQDTKARMRSLHEERSIVVAMKASRHLANKPTLHTDKFY